MQNIGKVSKLYQNKIDIGELEPNAGQYNMVSQYDSLLEQITDTVKPTKGRFFSNVFRKKTNKVNLLKGFYIYGEVGRGKTMLMDLFYDAVPITAKMRSHFNDFMQDVQNRLNYYRLNPTLQKNKTAIELVAEEINQKAYILCFDEFSVTDIADAMILARLFSYLFARGTILIATSNVAPGNLYRNGLNRDLFMPFIPVLEKHCLIINTNIDKDFRLEKTKKNFYYFLSTDRDDKLAFMKQWQELCLNNAESNKLLEVKGRNLQIKKCCNNAVFFTFEELCTSALSVNDYNEIVKNFDIIFLDGIPYFNDENINWSKRFILLIDILYEHNIKIFALAADNINNLYIGKAQRTEKFEFSRTSSRLFEMQSEEYIKKWQQKYNRLP